MRALVIVAACSCNHVPVGGTAPAAAAAELAPKPFAVPDETMEFRTSLRGITVGVVQTAIGKPGWVGDRRAIIARSRGKSDGLASLLGEISWELSSTIDLDAGYPIADRENAWISIAGHDEHHGESRRWDGGDHRHDVHSVIGLLRGWHSMPGQRTSAEVELAGARFAVVVWNSGREYLTKAMKPAVRYDGRAHDAVPFAIWISDDAARVPLAFRAETPIGAIAIELVDYQISAP